MAWSKGDRARRRTAAASGDASKRRGGRPKGSPRRGPPSRVDRSRSGAGEDEAAKKTLAAGLRSKWPVVRFVGVVGLLIGVFYLVFLPFTQSDLFQRYLAIIAQVTGLVLDGLGQDVTVAGQSVFSSRFAVEISLGCDGLEVTGLFAAAVLASPVSLRSRLLFLLAGTGVLWVINVLRVVTLFLIGAYFPGALDVMHLDAWPGVLIVLVFVCWLFWARWAARKEGFFADASL